VKKATNPIQHYSKFWHETTYGGSSLIYQLVEGQNLPKVGVDYVCLKKGATLKAHYHKLPNVLILVLKGAGRVRLNDKKYSIKAGDVISIKPKTIHGFSTNTSLEFLSIQSPPIYGKAADKDTYFVD